MRGFLKSVIATLSLGPLAALALPILDVDSNGQLLGASNVDVNGSLYDVEFVEGNCFTIFNNCDEESFTFTTQAAARAASSALLEQVFTDSDLGNFDSAPYLTAGCTASNLCEARTPYLIAFGVRLDIAVNSAFEYLDGFRTVETSFAAPSRPDAIWAVWTAIPEPSTILLLAFGLVAVGHGYKRGQRLSV